MRPLLWLVLLFAPLMLLAIEQPLSIGLSFVLSGHIMIGLDGEVRFDDRQGVRASFLTFPFDTGETFPFGFKLGWIGLGPVDDWRARCSVGVMTLIPTRTDAATFLHFEPGVRYQHKDMAEELTVMLSSLGRDNKPALPFFTGFTGAVLYSFE